MTEHFNNTGKILYKCVLSRMVLHSRPTESCARKIVLVKNQKEKKYIS